MSSKVLGRKRETSHRRVTRQTMTRFPTSYVTIQWLISEQANPRIFRGPTGVGLDHNRILTDTRELLRTQTTATTNDVHSRNLRLKVTLCNPKLDANALERSALEHHSRWMNGESVP